MLGKRNAEGKTLDDGLAADRQARQARVRRRHQQIEQLTERVEHSAVTVWTMAPVGGLLLQVANLLTSPSLWWLGVGCLASALCFVALNIGLKRRLKRLRAETEA